MQQEASVSAIIPARDEELNVARAVRSLAAQQDISEIIVVDDQSRDRTPEILAELKKQYCALRTLRLDHLPEGWMGKSRAAAEGAKLATGEWLLFTDADTAHRFGSLAALLARAQRDRADLLSISPGQCVETWWEKAVIPLVYVQLARLYRFEEVNDPTSPAAAANGQYILIRKSAYERIGGHEAVRDAVLEDVELARRVKAAGGRIIFLPGAEWAETRMYRTFRQMWRGWTKNLFLLYGGNSGRILGTIFELMLMPLLPQAATVAFLIWLWITPAQIWFEVAAIACFALFLGYNWNYSRQLKRLGFPAHLWMYLWMGAPLLSLMLLNSLRAYKRAGSIEWKGRTYSVKRAL